MKVKAIDENIYLKERKIQVKDLTSKKDIDDLKPVVLFEDSSGTNGSVSLSESKTKYKKLKILAKTNTNTPYTCEILTTDTFLNICIVDDNGTSNGTAWLKANKYNVNDKELTFYSAFWKNINSNETGTDPALKIYQVLGLNE